MVIWKQELTVTDLQTILFPDGAKILTVQTQFNRPCIWFLCDPNNNKVPRTFVIYGTGNPVNKEAANYTYIGTFQLDDGRLVFHVFEF